MRTLASPIVAVGCHSSADEKNEEEAAERDQSDDHHEIQIHHQSAKKGKLQGKLTRVFKLITVRTDLEITPGNGQRILYNLLFDIHLQL
jgi:hypothetical protein